MYLFPVWRADAEIWSPHGMHVMSDVRIYFYGVLVITSFCFLYFQLKDAEEYYKNNKNMEMFKIKPQKKKKMIKVAFMGFFIFVLPYFGYFFFMEMPGLAWGNEAYSFLFMYLHILLMVSVNNFFFFGIIWIIFWFINNNNLKI